MARREPHVARRLTVQISGGGKRTELPVSLRGTLAQEYLIRQQENEHKASVWIRKLVEDAGSGHPELELRLEHNTITGTKRFLIGRKDEVGMFPPDW